jgi:hypothetical protein
MQLSNSLSHPGPFYHKEENGKSNNIKVFERNNTKIKGALDSQPQVIKFTSCLSMVGGSVLVLRHEIAEILLKVALKHKKSKSL